MAASPRILFALKIALSLLIVLQSFLLIIVETLLNLSHAVAIVLITGIVVDALALLVVIQMSRRQPAP